MTRPNPTLACDHCQKERGKRGSKGRWGALARPNQRYFCLGPFALSAKARARSRCSKATFAFYYCNGYCSYFYLCIFVFLFTSWPLLHFVFVFFLLEDLLASASRQRLQIRTKLSFASALLPWFCTLTLLLQPSKSKARLRPTQNRGKQMEAHKRGKYK